MMKKKPAASPSFMREMEDSFYYTEDTSTAKASSPSKVRAMAASRAPAKAPAPAVVPVQQPAPAPAPSVRPAPLKLVSFRDMRQESSLSDFGDSGSCYDLDIPLNRLQDIEADRRGTGQPEPSPASAAGHFDAAFSREDPANDEEEEENPLGGLSAEELRQMEKDFGMTAVLQLLDMGFPLGHARLALTRCAGDVQRAIVFCLEHDDQQMAGMVQQQQQQASQAQQPQHQPVALTASGKAQVQARKKSFLQSIFGSKASSVPVPVPVSTPAPTVPAVNPNFREALPPTRLLSSGDIVLDDDVLAAAFDGSADEFDRQPDGTYACRGSSSSSNSNRVQVMTSIPELEISQPAPAAAVVNEDVLHGTMAAAGTADTADVDEDRQIEVSTEIRVAAAGTEDMQLEPVEAASSSDQEGVFVSEEEAEDAVAVEGDVVAASAVAADVEEGVLDVLSDALAAAALGAASDCDAELAAASVAADASSSEDPVDEQTTPATTLVCDGHVAADSDDDCEEPEEVSDVLPQSLNDTNEAVQEAVAVSADDGASDAPLLAQIQPDVQAVDQTDAADAVAGNRIEDIAAVEAEADADNDQEAQAVPAPITSVEPSSANVPTVAATTSSSIAAAAMVAAVVNEAPTPTAAQQSTLPSSPAVAAPIRAVQEEDASSVASGSVASHSDTATLGSLAASRAADSVVDSRIHHFPAAPSRIPRRGAPLVNKRQYLPYQVTQVEGKWKGTISLRQTQLSRKEPSPQGSRADQLALGSCPTREICVDLCESVAPPMWTSKAASPNCILCAAPFSMFSKGHHCRNCGHIVCSNCSDKLWPATMLPPTYHNAEKIVRVCHSCHLLVEQFVFALKTGDADLALAVYASGNVNVHNPLTVYQNHGYAVTIPHLVALFVLTSLHQIHCAASGGNVSLFRWLVEVKKCALFDRGTQHPLTTASGLSVLAIAAQQGHLELMNYLVHVKRCSVSEITDPAILQRALHAALKANGPLPDLRLPKVPIKTVSDDLIFKRSTEQLTAERRDRAILQNAITAAALNKQLTKPRPFCVHSVQQVADFLFRQPGQGHAPGPTTTAHRPPLPAAQPRPVLSLTQPMASSSARSAVSSVSSPPARQPATAPSSPAVSTRPGTTVATGPPTASSRGSQLNATSAALSPTPATSAAPRAAAANSPNPSNTSRSAPVVSAPTAAAVAGAGRGGRTTANPAPSPVPAAANASNRPAVLAAAISAGSITPPSPTAVMYSAQPRFMHRVVSIAQADVVRAEALGTTMEAYATDADIPVEAQAFLSDDIVFAVTASGVRSPSSS